MRSGEGSGMRRGSVKRKLPGGRRNAEAEHAHPDWLQASDFRLLARLTIAVRMAGVFKAYDIRGRTDTGELTPELARAVGGAFVLLTRASQIAVGRDCRASSPALAAAFVDGITAQRSSVLDL